MFSRAFSHVAGYKTDNSGLDNRVTFPLQYSTCPVRDLYFLIDINACADYLRNKLQGMCGRRWRGWSRRSRPIHGGFRASGIGSSLHALGGTHSGLRGKGHSESISCQGNSLECIMRSRNRRGTARSTRRTFGLENLEPRQMMAADFVGPLPIDPTNGTDSAPQVSIGTSAMVDPNAPRTFDGTGNNLD